MKDTAKKPLGRPLKYGKRMDRMQLVIHPDQRKRLDRQAKRTERSVSELVRDLLEEGLNRRERSE